MALLVKPTFTAASQRIAYPTEPLNGFMATEYADKFGFYQQTFGAFSYMRLTQDLKFRVKYPQGSPLVWQPHNSCAWSPVDSITYGENVIEPCRAVFQESRCYDEWFDPAFKALLEWADGGGVGFSAAGEYALNQLVRTIVQNAALGARLTLTAGKLYTSAGVTFQAGTPSNLQTLFNSTVETCRGWVALLRDLGATISHLDLGIIQGADISADAKKYTGDVLDLYDANFAGAPEKLQSAVMEGGIDTQPIWFVSPSIFRAVYERWLAIRESAVVNDPRIRRESFEYQGRTVYAYFIDNTAVVPVNEVNHYDSLITQKSHFCYLTLGGIVQMGASFATLPAIEEDGVAVIIERSTRPKDYGEINFLAHALMATAVNDTDYIAGDYLVAVPA